MTAATGAEEQATDRWSALGGVLLSALYLWVVVWLLLAVVLPTVGFGWQPAVITSGSMEPLIRPGDVVLSSRSDTIEPGNVVIYEDPAKEGTLTTHRVLSVDEDGTLRTQGDANQSPDSTPVPAENLVGRGRLLVPLIGLPLLWLSSGLVLFALWVAVTTVSVIVVTGSAGAAAPRPADATDGAQQRGGRVRRGLRGVGRRLGAVRPRRVQRAIVAFLVRQARRLHDAVYRGWRPRPSRLRRGAPSIAIIGLTLALARTAATITAGTVGLVLVLLFDPDGPYLRIGRWERLAVRGLRMVTAALPSAAVTRAVLAVVVVAGVGGAEVGRSAAAFQGMTGNPDNYFHASPDFPADLTLWLQTSPTGSNTTSSAYLPLSTTEPTETTLYNYDTDRDTDIALTVATGATSPHESDAKKVQRWTYTPTSDLTLAGVDIIFHSSMKDYHTAPTHADEVGTVTWYLRHCTTSGTDCVEIADLTFDESDWNGGVEDFVEKTGSFGSLSHVVPAGRELELVATVPAAKHELWFAYGTTSHLSRIEIDEATAGVCPGSGSAEAELTGDTYVDQNMPATANGGTNELHVRSEAGKNRRTLVTVWLPTIPDGCSLTSATLNVTTRTSKPGRTFVVQRTDTSFAPGTVTWNTQPTVSGPTSTAPSTVNGPTPIDATDPVQELYDSGNTGLMVRDSAEGAASSNENRFHSTESRPYPDPEGATLEVTWGP